MTFEDTVTVEVKINGTAVTETVGSSMLLSTFLRDRRNLTGVHRGCESVKCGACTVLLDGEAIKSCSVLAVQADECEITTVEGLGRHGELHPIQESFWKNNGMQCGFCTPGLVMTTHRLLEDGENLSRDEITEGISGHICRCTGYTKIVESIQDAGATMEDSQ